MSAESIFIGIFIIGVVLGLLFAAFTLIGAAVYDILYTRKERVLRQVPYNKTYRYRPFLSVIIPVHNESMVIERCLRALLKSSYRKFEIIVADDKSTDNTRELVRKFIREHPSRQIRLAAKRKNGGRGAAIDAGLRHAKGELIMALDADCLVEKYALRNMVRHFADKQTVAVAANIHIMDAGDTISLLQQLDYLVSFKSKKFNTLANCEYIIGGAGATYRRQVIKQLRGFDHSMQTEDIEMSLRIARELGNKNSYMKYASDAVIYTEPVPTYRALFKQRYRWKFGSLQAMYKHQKLLFSRDFRNHSMLLTLLRLPFVLWSELMLLLEPFFFAFFIYIAISRNNVALFVSAAIMMIAIFLLAIWPEYYLSLRSRIKLSLYAPFMYVAFYVITIIQVMAIFKSLVNYKGIIGKKKIVGAYVSPERIGNESPAIS